MNIELIEKLLSTRRVEVVDPDHFLFDFGVKIHAVRFDELFSFQRELESLCEHSEFSIDHLRALLLFVKE